MKTLFKNLLMCAICASALFLIGCDKEDEIHSLYQVMVFPGEERAVSRDDYRVEDNELYKLISGCISEVAAKYDGKSIEEESEALAAYNEIIARLEDVKQEMEDRISTGKDFGAAMFKMQFFCSIYKDGKEMKTSEMFSYEYTSNTRFSVSDEIIIDASSSPAGSGEALVMISDQVEGAKMVGWALHKENGELSTSGMITKVELVEEAGTGTSIRVDFSTGQGVEAGSYYIISTLQFPDDTIFDVIINVILKAE